MSWSPTLCLVSFNAGLTRFGLTEVWSAGLGQERDMAANAQGLRPIPLAYYGFTLHERGTRIAVVACAHYADADGIQWGYCYSTVESTGGFRAIHPMVTELAPAVGENAIRLIAGGKSVPSELVAQLRELPEALWRNTRSLAV